MKTFSEVSDHRLFGKVKGKEENREDYYERDRGGDLSFTDSTVNVNPTPSPLSFLRYFGIF